MSVTPIRRAQHGDSRISPIFLAIAAVMVASGWAVWREFASNKGFAVFLFVVSGWLVSLCLHEYAHARTALHSGDISIESKGYLTLNPLKYTNALLSVILPVIFVIAGGIGLPGGAVFIERGRIRGRWRHSLISAAGPLVNVLFAIVLMLPFALGKADSWPTDFMAALAFLARLQVTAAILNLLPVPGLDGYGIWEPWLSYNIRRQVEPFAQFGLLAVFGVLWIPSVNIKFFDAINSVMGWFNVHAIYMDYGYTLFRFWKNQG
ncbi:site-2 protease family protein [Actinacidiphila acididurans]|uniref:Site-2 protease family protein n=1 Tax=Actinacidiphila acididurans TaxID=2784346 RepID=A0ABS2TPW3_9ACTN|nr:site-2 protease family protein [Actinacidiphila acididurans]MBM9505356.1 site-2 protease family protein [Actinacidiphila acididurans]